MGTHQEHDGHEQTSVAATAEINPLAVKQQISVFATDRADTPAPPLDAAELQTFLLEWVRMPDWQSSQHYLQAHPKLLTEAAVQALRTLIYLQTDKGAQDILTWYAQLLQVTTLEGLEVVYSLLLKEDNQAVTQTNKGVSIEGLAPSSRLGDLPSVSAGIYPATHRADGAVPRKTYTDPTGEGGI